MRAFRLPVKMTRLAVFASVVAACLLASACGKQEAAQARGREPAVKAIKKEAVKQAEVHRTVEVVATLAAEDEVTVSSQAEGVVKRVLADLGDAVKADQPLVELDREKLQYNLDQQKAALNRSLTKYGASDLSHLPVAEDTPDVRKAAAELAQAKQSFERAGELQKRQLIPQQTLDDARVALQTKQASYDSALQTAKNLRADIDVADATLKLADRQLRDTFIRAPFSGAIQKRMVSVGELVKGQMPVMTVVRVDPLKALAEIPEKMTPWVKGGQPITLRVDAFPGKTFTGSIARISPAVNTQTRAFAFEATVPNSDGTLKPGTFARVRLETSMVESVLTIPYAAMQYRYGVYRAFVVNGDRLAVRELKTGDRAGDRMEILDGLKIGEEVALTDVDNLADGMKITLGAPNGGGGRGRGERNGNAASPARGDAPGE
jgi:multidrug efflux pump subunit AcrA (membrane-fusion protein)